MLNNISWASYVLAISISVLIYYIFVLALFYRRELQNIISQNLKGQYHSARETDNTITDEQDIDNNEPKALPDQSILLPELLLLLQNLVNTGTDKNYPKEEILLSLRLKLQQYPSYKKPDQQERINHYILTSFESICSIHLSEEEISALWIK